MTRKHRQRQRRRIEKLCVTHSGRSSSAVTYNLQFGNALRSRCSKAADGGFRSLTTQLCATKDRRAGSRTNENESQTATSRCRCVASGCRLDAFLLAADCAGFVFGQVACGWPLLRHNGNKLVAFFFLVAVVRKFTHHATSSTTEIGKFSEFQLKFVLLYQPLRAREHVSGLNGQGGRQTWAPESRGRLR